MDNLATLVSLSELKSNIDELSKRIKKDISDREDSCDSGKVLIIILSVIGALVLVGVVAFLVYRYFSDDYLDDYDDYDDLFDDEEEAPEDEYTD